MQHEQEPSEATAQEAEHTLLRRVFETARSLLRFNGVDRARADRAYGELDMACEQVKLLDGGMMDAEDVQSLVHGGPLMGTVLEILKAYEDGYGEGLVLSAQDNVHHDRYQDPRLNLAFCLGYRKGARLSNRQGAITPHAIRNERDRTYVAHNLLTTAPLGVPGMQVTDGGSDAVAKA